MTTDETERFLAACRLLGSHAEEERLLMSEVTEVKIFRDSTSATYQVTFADGSRGAFKSIEGAEASASSYGHTAASVIVNDYAAWLVARGLGYESLVGGVVLTTCPLAGVGLGSMQTWLPGDPSGAGWEQASSLPAAGLFDALIAQQDRNGSNFNFESSTDELGLFDQSFTFALPGHQVGASSILDQLHSDDRADLTDDLRAALDRYEASAQRAALQEILEGDRWTRMEERLAKMKTDGKLLQPGEY